MIASVERVPVERLRFADWNPRRISEDRLANLKRSLEADPRLLELRPILATADGEVYAGNMRLRAAIALGWSDVPAVLEDVDERTKRERMVRDNAQWGEWEDEELARILQQLAEDGSDTAILGLDDAEVTKLLDRIRAAEAEADLSPALDNAPTRVQVGDLWIMGEHRLVCGDSRDTGGVLTRLLGNELVDAVWTDPPYGVNYVGGTGMTIQNDDVVGLADLLANAFGSASKVMRPGAAVYVAAPERHLALFGQAFVAADWLLHQTLVWIKDDLVLGHSDYHFQHEPILYGWKRGGRRTWLGERVQTTVADRARPPAEWSREELEAFVESARRGADIVRVARPRRSVDHPTMKPVELVEHHLKNSTKRGDIVLDLFAGSGSTLVAAHQLERRGRAVELDPHYCDVILARWERLTGKKAERA